MEITISHYPAETTISLQLEQTVIAVLKKAAEIYDLATASEVSLVLANNEYIQKLNCQYRGKDMPTDVLSFALNEGDEPVILDGSPENLLGDIVISLETAAVQAEEYGHSLKRELAYLTVHGMLHLLGYDHETTEDQQEMRSEEEHVLSAMGIIRV